MFCNNCGREIADDVVFCTCCGVRIKDTKAVADDVAETAAPEIAATDSAVQAEPVQTAQPPQEDKQKQYFGMGALIFCLILIGILSISTGVFAGLYFSLR